MIFIHFFHFQDENQAQNNEETTEQTQNWAESPTIRRRKYDEISTFSESPEIQKVSQNNNSFVVEDEFDAIGRNVAAKLRNMRLDQRIVAEKLLNDVLFEAQLGTLHRDSSLHVWGTKKRPATKRNGQLSQSRRDKKREKKTKQRINAQSKILFDPNLWI